MNNKLRRFEILLPLQFNDGRAVPFELLGEAIAEIVAQFGAASYEPQNVEGYWRHEGIFYRDTLSKVVIDISDTADNREWMRNFKLRCMNKLEQLDLWLVSYEIDVE